MQLNSVTFRKSVYLLWAVFALWKTGRKCSLGSWEHLKAALPPILQPIFQWDWNYTTANTQLPIWLPPISLFVLEHLGLKGFFLMSNPKTPSASRHLTGRLARFHWGPWSTLEIWALKINRNMTMWPFVCLAKSVYICFCVPVWACVCSCRCGVMKHTSVHRSVSKQIFESHRQAHPGGLCLPFGCHDSSEGLQISKQSSQCVWNLEKGSGAGGKLEPEGPQTECFLSKWTYQNILLTRSV